MELNKIMAEDKKTDKEKAQDFVKEYETLCKERGYQIVVIPSFKARDDGTWSVVLQSSVSKIV